MRDHVEQEPPEWVSQLVTRPDMGEIRVGRWVLRWVPAWHGLPFEFVIGRLKKDEPDA